MPEQLRRRLLQGMAAVPVVLACGGLRAVATAPEPLDSGIDRAFQRMRRAGLPGTVVGIRAGDGLPRVWTLGSANAAGTVPIRRDHVFRIGSIAKAVVGHLVLRAHDESLLGLGDPLSTWIAGMPRGDQITIDMLARHRSGLANPIADPVFRAKLNRHPERHLQDRELMDYLRASDRHTPPGETFSYSNANTVLLGEIVQRASGLGLNELIERWLLLDFGLGRPRVPAGAELPEQALRGYRFGPEGGGFEYGQYFFDATRFSASWAGAGGNMNATVDDLLALARPLASGHGLSEAARLTRLRFDPVSASFDYGFHIARLRGTLVGHSGDVPGFSSFMALDTVTDCSIVVLCNLSNFADKSAPAQALGLFIAELLRERA